MTAFLKNVSTKILLILKRQEGDGYASEDVLAPLSPVELTLKVAVVIWFKISASLPLVIIISCIVVMVSHDFSHFFDSGIGKCCMNSLHVELLNAEAKICRQIKC